MKEGYKETEVGKIPVEWKVKKLSEVTDIVSGGTPKTNVTEYWDNPTIHWATPTDITKNGKYICETEKKISEIGLNNSSANLLPIGTVLMTSRATVGEKCINTTPMATNQGFKSFICSEFLNNEFLYYYIDILKEVMISLSAGSTFIEISKSTVGNLKIAVPSIDEQEKIADILSTVDSQIDDTDKLIEKTRELKKGLMQRLLTKGIGHTEFKKTEVGEIPIEWEIKSLGKVFKLSSGEFLSQKNIIDGPYPVYGGNGITGYHNEFKHKDSKIVIGRVGAKCGCVCRSIKESWITDNALYINEKLCEFDDEFMLYLLYYLDLNKFANQNAQPVISGQKIYVINIALPNLEEQKKIANILSSIDMQIEEYENKNIKLEELKKGLMQQLLTGKIRVKI
ncbi:restriction endonuclease subunit S [Clostridium paraputrificum]|uniref:restriction endonuclease subunit S n=1 Tax=Clostridium paraputrificum TaxID=29363 RepID=UPI0018A04C07|nr:restriction endonuclease subunit S [Clostridium paraputrificum]MDB2092527.1 restriction endonuclease subunit S [Clostridium paraputrificum]